MSYRPFEVHTDASALKYLTTMKYQSGLFTRWYKKLAGFNFTVIHKKGKENSNTDALSRSSHMAEAPPLAKDDYAKFYGIDEPVISWVEKRQLPEKAETRGKAQEVLVACSIFDPEVFTKAAYRNQTGEVRRYVFWSLWLKKCGVSAIRATREGIEDWKEC